MVNYQKMNDETRRSYETAFGMNMNMDSLDLDLDLDDDDEQRSKSGHHYIGNSSSSSNSEKETELQKTASHEHHQHHQHHQHPLINKRPPRPYYQYPMNPSRSYASCVNLRRALAFEEKLARQSASSSECFLGERSKSLESFFSGN
eukprot:493553_1